MFNTLNYFLLEVDALYLLLTFFALESLEFFDLEKEVNYQKGLDWPSNYW